jgi:hypothetical protein
MLSKKTNQALKLSGLAALALATACSEESEPNNNVVGQNDAAVIAGDAGTGLPPANDGGVAAGSCQSIFNLPPSALCTTTAGAQGYRTCQNNVPVGDCIPLPTLGDAGLGGLFGDAGLGGLLGDAGLGGLFGDGGLSGILADSGLTFGEGGVMLGDATIPMLEAGTIKCQAPLTCLETFKSFTGGISTCAPAGAFLPPAGDCTMASGACKLEGAMGSCIGVPLVGNLCLVPCN